MTRRRRGASPTPPRLLAARRGIGLALGPRPQRGVRQRAQAKRRLSAGAGEGRVGAAVQQPLQQDGVVALRRWSAVRADDTLDDYDKALALSTIFREYAEAAIITFLAETSRCIHAAACQDGSRSAGLWVVGERASDHPEVRGSRRA